MKQETVYNKLMIELDNRVNYERSGSKEQINIIAESRGIRAWLTRVGQAGYLALRNENAICGVRSELGAWSGMHMLTTCSCLHFTRYYV